MYKEIDRVYKERKFGFKLNAQVKVSFIKKVSKLDLQLLIGQDRSRDFNIWLLIVHYGSRDQGSGFLLARTDHVT